MGGRVQRGINGVGVQCDAGRGKPPLVLREARDLKCPRDTIACGPSPAAQDEDCPVSRVPCPATTFPPGQNAMIAIRGNPDRGKSELHRADRQVTPGRREATDRATESKPPMALQGAQARVKRWGKSPPLQV